MFLIQKKSCSCVFSTVLICKITLWPTAKSYRAASCSDFGPVYCTICGERGAKRSEQKGVSKHQTTSGKTQAFISLPMYFFSSKLRHHCVPICHSPGGILDSLGVFLLMMENATTVQCLIIKFPIYLSPVHNNISDRKSGSLLLKCSFTSVYLTTNPLLPDRKSVV